MGFREQYLKIYKIFENEQNLIKQEIEKTINENFCQLTPELKVFFNLPSKHIRSIISFLYIKASGYEIDEKQIIYQAVIEIIHNASLIHDDVIDESLQRRGTKSFKAGFGNHLSVIAGDLILASALKLLAKLNKQELLFIISETITNMCKGETEQEYSKFKIPSIEEYIEKTYNKTGALFTAAICGAEFLAKGTYNQNTLEFAKNFGIAFQIRDDILNITENKSDSDIENGIYTAPIIFSGDKEVSKEGIEKAKSLLNNYISEAGKNILEFRESEYKTAILKLLELINYE